MENITKNHAIVFLGFLLLAFLLFYKIGDNFLTHWDEAWHADVSRNVAQSGDLIKLRWNGEPFFDKPPVYFWLSALSMKLFGFTEFAARLPSVVAGFGVGVLLYLLARMLCNKSVALISLLVFSSTIGFLFRARTGNLDALLIFWILASMVSFYKAYQLVSVKWFVIMGVALGFGFLTKGAIVFAFPFVCLIYLLIRKEYPMLKPKFLLGSFLIGASISLLWVFVSFLINGEGFIEGFFVNQTGKLSTSIYFSENFSFEYILHVKSGLKIWFVPFALSFFYSLYKWRNTRNVILSIYLLLFFSVLSFSENKSNWFLMPLYPITALMIGYTVYEFGKKFFINSSALTTLVFIVASLQLFFYRNEFIVPDITVDDAKVAIAAKSETEENDILYLTNYYYPTVVYYGERKTYAVYSEHEENLAWWVKPKTAWRDILKNKNVFIVTNSEEFEILKQSYPNYKFTVLYEKGEKKLVKKI